MCINEKLGNNPLARDQRFHVTRKDHLNPEAPTIRGGFNSSNHTIDVARRTDAIGVHCHVATERKDVLSSCRSKNRARNPLASSALRLAVDLDLDL